MTITIQLSPEDTLPSTLARLRSAQDERVLFVVPPELTLGLIDLRVLRREAAAECRGAALVTSDAALRAVAAQVGISTFRSQARGERAHWHRLGRIRSIRSRPVGSAETVVPPGPGLYARRLPPGFRQAAFLRSFVRRHSPWWGDLLLALLLIVIFGGLVLALATVIPAAEVSVVPASEPIQITVPLRAIQDAAADAEAGILPAKALSVQVAGEAQIPTSGRRREPSAKAGGTVIVVNRTGRALTIAAGTVVVAATGDNVRFQTKTQAQVEPNGRAAVPIEALLPGPTGNVRAGTITQVEGPLSTSLLVTNEGPTGGGNAAEVGVVTEDDQARLQARLFEELKQKALDQLRERLEPGNFLPPDSVTFLTMSPTFTPFVGDVSPDLFLSMSVQAVGLAVDTQAGNKLALARLQSTMPPGTRLIRNSLRYIPGAIIMENATTIAFSMTAEGTLLRSVDVRAARTTVLGMSANDARHALDERFALATEPKISLGPDWLPLIVPTNLPVLPWRIRVNVDWDAAAALAVQS